MPYLLKPQINSSPRPHGLSRAHTITLGGLALVPDLSGALFVPDYGALLVADLHLEKGTSLAKRGVHLPPYDTRESLRQLGAVINTTQPQRLMFLGDSFHDKAARERIDDDDLAVLRSITSQVETVWITGNHDPAPPGDVGGTVTNHAALGPLTLRHEQKPLADNEFEVSGHLHPAAAVVSRGHRVRCRCFIGDQRRLILPAFGSYTGALGISSEAFAGLFGDFNVWMIGASAIHRFPARKVR